MHIKQSNASYEVITIRVFQCLSVFIHIYCPDNDFLYAAMSIFFQKLGEQKITEKEEEYIRYFFKRMIRMIEHPSKIDYIPVKYQMMALMCRRQISHPVYLPVGASAIIRMESYQTLADIKVSAM